MSKTLGIFFYTIYDDARSNEMYSYKTPIHKCWYNDYKSQNINMVYDKVCTSWVTKEDKISCDNFRADVKNFSKDDSNSCVKIVDGDLEQSLCNWIISDSHFNGLPIPTLLGNYVNK